MFLDKKKSDLVVPCCRRTFLNGGLSWSLINNTSTGSQRTQPWYWSWSKNCVGTPVLRDIDHHQVFLEDHALCEHSSFNRAVTSTRVVTANREFLDCGIKNFCVAHPVQFAITLRLASIPNIPSFYFLSVILSFIKPVIMTVYIHIS